MAVINKPFDEAVIAIAAWPTVLLAFAAPAIIGWQSWFWLQSGRWMALPISFLLDAADIQPPRTAWVGAQIIIDWLLAMPISLLCVLLAAAWFSLSLAVLRSIAEGVRARESN